MKQILKMLTMLILVPSSSFAFPFGGVSVNGTGSNFGLAGSGRSVKVCFGQHGNFDLSDLKDMRLRGSVFGVGFFGGFKSVRLLAQDPSQSFILAGFTNKTSQPNQTAEYKFDKKTSKHCAKFTINKILR